MAVIAHKLTLPGPVIQLKTTTAKPCKGPFQHDILSLNENGKNCNHNCQLHAGHLTYTIIWSFGWRIRILPVSSSSLQGEISAQVCLAPKWFSCLTHSFPNTARKTVSVIVPLLPGTVLCHTRCPDTRTAWSVSWNGVPAPLAEGPFPQIYWRWMWYYYSQSPSPMPPHAGHFHSHLATFTLPCTLIALF